jgi:hypothetical protein
MPFGRYRGQLVADLPDNYLSWLLTIDLRSPQLLTAVFGEWSRRQYLPADLRADKHAIVLSRDELPLASRLVDAGRKALAKQLHPDRGGDPQQMVALNVLADNLKEQLELFSEAA